MATRPRAEAARMPWGCVACRNAAEWLKRCDAASMLRTMPQDPANHAGFADVTACLSTPRALA